MIWIIPIVALLLLVFWLKSPKGKGMIGELRVKLTLGKNVENEKYVINNLMIENDEGKTSQIDHVLINKNGIFVIETKNYAGRIYGKENHLEWTQVLAYGKIKNKLYNPLKQNATHIYRIKKIIGNELPIISVVVFVRGNTQYIEANNVYNIKELKREIKKLREEQIQSDKIKEIYYKLEELKKNCSVSNKQHIKNIDKMKKELNEGVCPRCGANLIKRNGKSGEFLGCSNYPKCKFTKKI